MRGLIKSKWVYYKGKAPATIYRDTPFDFKLTTKEEVNMFIEADEDIGKLKYKIIQPIVNFVRHANFVNSKIRFLWRTASSHNMKRITHTHHLFIYNSTLATEGSTS